MGKKLPKKFEKTAVHLHLRRLNRDAQIDFTSDKRVSE